MTDEITTESVDLAVPEDVSLFPTLDLIADQFVSEDGVDFEGLTTEQLLFAVRESFLMHHQALQELAASIQTLGMFLGQLDDRVESLLFSDGAAPATPVTPDEAPASPVYLPNFAPPKSE